MKCPNVSHAQHKETYVVENADTQGAHLLMTLYESHPSDNPSGPMQINDIWDDKSGEWIRLAAPTPIVERTRYKVKIVMTKCLDPNQLATVRRSIIHLYGAEYDEIPTCKWFIFEDSESSTYSMRTFPNLEGDMGFLYRKSVRDMTRNELEWILAIPAQINHTPGYSYGGVEEWVQTRFEVRAQLGLLDENEMGRTPIEFTCCKC